MSGRNQSDLRPLLRKARKAGVRVERTNGGHIRLLAPNGDWYISSSTPGSAKTIYRIRSWFRRQGLVVAL